MMTILILQGPNLNLLGKKSAEIGDSLTLNKLNELYDCMLGIQKLN